MAINFDAVRKKASELYGTRQEGFAQRVKENEQKEEYLKQLRMAIAAPTIGMDREELNKTLGEMTQRQEALKQQLSERENSGDMGGTTLLRKEYNQVSHQLNALQKKYKDNFFGQFGASYTQGRLSQDEAQAWSDYLTMPTEQNRQKAETLSSVLEHFQVQNRKALKDDATLPWLSQSLAGYLPQFIDQTKAQVSGGLVGAGVGSAVPGLGTVTGAKAGATAASGMYSYNTMRGSAFRDLLKLGFDEETARAAANDEALVSAMIEMGDTLMDMSGLSFGAGTLIDMARNGLAKKFAKEGAEAVAESAAKKLLKGLARYGMTVGGEMLEEGSQQAVSIANRDRLNDGGEGGTAALTGRAARVAWDALRGANDKARNEIWEAAAEGGKIAAMMGGINAGVTTVGNMVLNGDKSQNPVENPVGKGENPVTTEPTKQPEADLMQEDAETAAILRQVAEEMERERTTEQTGAEVPSGLSDLLSNGNRVDMESLTEHHLAEWDKQGGVWVDAANRAYQMRPEDHISQRTAEDVSNRKVNAFQFDHPELRQYVTRAAEDLVKDASLSLNTPADMRQVRDTQGKKYVSEILDSPPLRKAMDMGLSRNEIIKAAEDLIADHGQENYAAAKRLELILDEMLTEGYTTVEGEVHEPDTAYIQAKAEIPGYQVRQREELPIWDMEEGVIRAAQAAYDAGRANVPRESAALVDPVQEEAYHAGRLEHIRNMNPSETVEKQETGGYTEGSKNENRGGFDNGRKENWSGAEGAALQNDTGTTEANRREAGETGEDGILRSVRVLSRGARPVHDWAEGGLTEEEASTLLAYKSSESYKVNAALRETGRVSEQHQKLVAAMDSALEKLPVYTGRVYRNLSFDDLGGKEAFDAFMAEHIADGIPLYYPAYTSSSTSREGYPVEGDFVAHMEIQGVNSRNLEGFGNNFESEVLFPRNTMFLVDRVSYDENGTPTIYMTEVANETGDERVSYRGIDGKQKSSPEGKENQVRTVSEFHSPDTDVQSVSQRNPENDPGGRGTLRQDGGEVSSQRAIADHLIKYISKGQDFTAAKLFDLADKHYGGTMAEGKYTVKDAYDAMELAVNRYLISADFIKEANGNAAKAREVLSKLEGILKHLPTQTKRTEEMEQFQQFSTPPNIAYLAAWCANVRDSDVVLEPSAGIGGLALWPKAWGATVYGNELSTRRLAFLEELGLDGTFNLNAEQIDNLLPESVKPSVVIMNPPFSSTAGRTNKNDTANAKRHIQQALDRLEDGGRLVAIVGNGMANDAPAFKSWWNELREEYSVRANIRLDGKNYRKYGTTFDEQLVVIDKTGPSMGATLTGEFSDLSLIPDFMEVIRNDRVATTERNAAIQSGERTASGTVEHEPVSDASVTAGDGGVHSGVSKTSGTEGVAGKKRDGRSSGKRGAKVRAGNVVSSDDNIGGRGDERQLSSEQDQRGNRPGGETLDTAGRSGKQSPEQRVSLDLTAKRDDTAAKEAAENPDNIYATYAPKKARITGTKKHPAKLVESAAMAAVEPPDVTYTPSLPARLVKDGVLSDAQMENIIYAGQAHEQLLPDGQRKGYFIGDGTGVGKGRQLSGIIMDNFMQGRDRAIWISENFNLYEDAVRDWTDLGGKKEDVLNSSKLKLGQDIKAKRGILFTTYDTVKYKKDSKTRLGDLERWLGKDFDGVICFDEAHNMANAAGKQGKRGNTKPSEKALAGIKLQKMFPKARIVYASATGATDISDYVYLDRLGLWGPGTAFHNAQDFISKISTGGLAAMELVARDMKAMGVYLARSISYDDVTYDTLQHDLNPMQTEIYNTMSRAWQTVFQNMYKALEVTGANLNGKARGAVNSVFYGTQQRFYNQVITSMSMPTVIADMKRELANGRSCVLQIVNTNEAQSERAISDAEKNGQSLDDLDLTPSETLIEMVRKSFPVQEYEEYTDENGNNLSRPVVDGNGNPVLSKKAIRMRDELIADLEQMRVPDGVLEMLFDAFGVDNVAEVTGRKRRVVEKLDANGQMHRTVEKRNKKMGIADAQMFQDGKKRILVFSNAGGTGKSYHADNRAKNQQKRVHYLIQPGWNASKATQGFGRTHRSNQANAPIFRLVTTNVMGQKRFTSTIARRLDQLGALTKGQRQAGSGIFGEKDNLEGPIAKDALYQYYKTLSPDVLKKLGLYNSIYDKNGKFNDSSDALWDIGKFLNRILSLEVDEQNEVFQGFYDTFDRMMDVAIANGTVDMGLENYRADKIEVLDEKVVRKDKTGADTKYVQMKTYHKPEIITLAKAKKLYQNFQGLVRTEDGNVRAVYEISSKTDPKTGEIQRRFRLESPVRGKASVFVESTMKKQTKPIDKAEWAQAWKEETAKAPEYNEGTLHLLTGTLLPIWDRLPANNTRVMRVISSDGQQFLGRVIRADEIDGVLKGLGANRTLQTFTPEQVSKAVLEQGKEVVFRDNKLRMTRRKVSSEWRMELTGQNIWYITRQIPAVISERINYEYRYFLPTGNEEALARLMELNPVVDIRDAAPTGEVDHRLVGGVVPDRSGEWTAKRVGKANVKPMRIAELVEQIHHDFEINITTGHIRGKGVAGQYSRNNHGIRSRVAHDLPTIAHELGHHIDLMYGLQKKLSPEQIKELVRNLDTETAKRYPADKLKAEGIAEFVRRFLQNRETAAIDYPLFTPSFMNAMPQKMRDLVVDLADKMNAYYALDADTATSSIRFREEKAPDARTVEEKLEDQASVLYQAWVDSNHGIKRFDRATGAETYKLATNAAYSDAMAGQIILGDLTDANGQYVAPGLKAALHGLNLNDKEEYRLFGEYLVVKHGPESLAEGMRVFADERKNSTAFMNRRQAELEAEYPQFAEISDRLYEFQRNFLQTWGVGTGLISQETAKEWGDRWQYYVPLNRVMGEQGAGTKRGFANQNSTIHRRHGSGRDIIQPVDNIINNIVKMVNAGVRNNVMRAITDQATSLGADAAFIEQVPAPLERHSFDMRGIKGKLSDQLMESGMDIDAYNAANDIVQNLDDILYQYGRGKAHGEVITVLKNGEPQFWKVNDDLMLESLTNMNQRQIEGLLGLYGSVSRFMTSNITGNNFIWSITSNAPRDLMSLFVYCKNHNLIDLIVALGSAFNNKLSGDKADPLYKEFLAMGGGKVNAYTSDRNLAKKARKSLAGAKFSANPLDWLAFVGDIVETGPRYATYKLMRQAGMNPQEAFYESQDITVNFRRHGTSKWSKQASALIPFFNAGVQGLDKYRRWIIAEELAGKPERRKVIRIRTATYLALSVGLAALIHGFNYDDKEKEKDYEQLSSYIKNNFWNFPLGDGKYFSLSKPRELAVPSSFFEALLSYAHGKDEHAFDEFYAYAAENWLPSVVSDIAKGDPGGAVGSLGVFGTLYYMGANRDFMGRPIVSSGLQNLEPKDQYTRRTSNIAYWIGQAFKEIPMPDELAQYVKSPQMLDYFFQQILGGWWKYQRAAFPVGEENRDLTFGIQSTYNKDNLYSTDLVNWLYDKAEKSEKSKSSDKENMDKSITAKMDGNMTTFYSRYYGLSKNKAETMHTRATRQLVLDMIREYQKADDHGALTPAQKAVYAVCKEEESTEYLPGVMQITVKDGRDVKHTLSDEQYVEFQTDYLRLYWEYVEDNLGNAAYGEKAAVLTAAKKIAREQAINRTLARICQPQTDFAVDYKGVSANDIVTFEAQKDLANDDGSLKQDEVIEILKFMVETGLPPEDAYTLFRSTVRENKDGEKSDKNNPWRRYK